MNNKVGFSYEWKVEGYRNSISSGWMNQMLGGGFFIRNLNDVFGSLWNQTLYVQKFYREKQTYTH